MTVRWRVLAVFSFIAAVAAFIGGIAAHAFDIYGFPFTVPFTVTLTAGVGWFTMTVTSHWWMPPNPPTEQWTEDQL